MDARILTKSSQFSLVNHHISIYFIHSILDVLLPPKIQVGELLLVCHIFTVHVAHTKYTSHLSEKDPWHLRRDQNVMATATGQRL